jgi:hypothetical protein
MRILHAALEARRAITDPQILEFLGSMQEKRRPRPDSISMEEASNGKAVREKEHTLYGRLPDLNDLKKAEGMEHQEQWQIKVEKTEKNAARGRIRVRKTVNKAGQVEYVNTTKVEVGEVASGDNVEVPIPTTEANFIQFRHLAEEGMIKDRYFFPVPDSDLVWEVDVFKKPNGEYYDWVKLDLEVSDLSAPIPALPLHLEDVIAAKYGERTDAEEARVTALYSNEFTAKNPYLK